MAKTDKYYKEFSLSGIPKSDLKNEEHANIYRTPAKDKVRPNLQGWKEDAVHQADLLQMPEDPKGSKYILTCVDVTAWLRIQPDLNQASLTSNFKSG